MNLRKRGELACCSFDFVCETADFAGTDVAWLAESAQTGLDIRFSVGLDGLGLWMFGLSALLFVTAVLVSWEAIEERAPLFYAMLLLLEFGCLGVFTARDIAHSFTIDQYRIAKRAAAGQTVVFEFRADQVGTHRFYCNLTADDRCRKMEGELIVR